MARARRTNGVIVKKFDCPIYGVTYHMIIVVQPSDARDYYHRISGLEPHPSTLKSAAYVQHTYDHKHCFHQFIVVPYNASKGTIAHEMKHAVNNTFIHIGMKLDPDNDEHEAYYLAYLIDQWESALIDFRKIKDKENEEINRKSKKPGRKSR